ncbi:hypothetical protein ACLOJK_015179 [Asimina triloba]
MVGGDRLVIYYANCLQWRSRSHVKLEKTFNDSGFPAGSRLERGAAMAKSWQPTLMGMLSVVGPPHAAVELKINDLDFAGHVCRGVTLIYVIWVGHPRSDTDYMVLPPSNRPLQLLTSLPCYNCHRRFPVPPPSTTIEDEGEGELPSITADLATDRHLAARCPPAASAPINGRMMAGLKSLGAAAAAIGMVIGAVGARKMTSAGDGVRVMLVVTVVVDVRPHRIGGRLIVVVTLSGSDLRLVAVGERCRTAT